MEVKDAESQMSFSLQGILDFFLSLVRPEPECVLIPVRVNRRDRRPYHRR